MKRKKCIFLIPTSYNNGDEIPAGVISGIKRELDEMHDGHTVDGVCDGSYRMSDGTFAKDRSLKIWVAVVPDQIDGLKRMVARFARLLRQECIYFEVADAEVEFIGPSLFGAEK